MLPGFRRKTDPAADGAATSAPVTGADAASDAEAPSLAGARSRSYTPSKGRATPKRKEGARRTAEKPPANRREAMRRMRQKQREERQEQRAGMMAGKEEYLLARDKGPERALVRDIVDSRRNVASYFLIGLLVVIVGSSQAMPTTVKLATDVFWALLAFALIVDSFLITRKIKKVIAERLPKSTMRTGGHYFYGIMRTLSPRRMRIPAPRVKLGDPV